MGVLWYLLIGLVVGVIARILHPGKENMGIILTLVIGVAGAFLAGLIGQIFDWYTFPSWIGIVVAIAVAFLLIVIYGAIVRKNNQGCEVHD